MSGPDYDKKEFWEKKYSKEDVHFFDWYHGWEKLEGVLKESAPLDGKVLMLGCGNSKLGEQMCLNGYKCVVNMDFSGLVIEKMKQRCKDIEGLSFLAMDARKMDFGDAEFQTVIDKGTLDAVICGEDHLVNVNLICKEVSRVLKPGGKFISISFGTPENRLDYLMQAKFHWDIDIKRMMASNDPVEYYHYFYTMTKCLHPTPDCKHKEYDWNQAYTDIETIK
eukprot:TRINITY_DN5301_c0_g1_i1.p1 TRINITY_DN5301_c0_g1~~TRINITY_DN5301_c0_g1_i1.p1  ORF type:complete len:222 (+),score=31.37 TRINITY_DN5301_c0_g1_i1:254-919(+)